MAYVRMGFAFNKEAHDRLLELCKELDMGQTPLMECLLFGMSNAQAREIVKEGGIVREEVIGRMKKMRQQAKKVVSDMSAAELQKILSNAAPKRG